MALRNLAQQTTTTLGSGTITLGPAVSGFLTFSGSGATNGETIPYAIADGVNSETGNGVYTVSGTYGSLVRVTVINSTNSGNRISLSGNAVTSITPNTTSFGVPTGTLLQYGGTTAPTGYLVCDGTAVSRTTYADLFTVLSTRYGTGDGSTTFNLPDLRGRVSVGYAASGGHSDVSTLGNSDGVAVANRRPKHRHTVNESNHSHSTTGYYQAAQGGGGFEGYGFSSNSGGGSSSFGTSATKTNLTVGNDPTNDPLDAPAYIVINYIIKT